MKKTLKTIIATFSLAATTIVVVPVAVVVTNNAKKDQLKAKHLYEFDNQVFTSQQEALNYAEKSLVTENNQTDFSNKWSFDMWGKTFNFNSPYALREYISKNYIIPISTASSVPFNKLQYNSNGSISSNDYQMININPENQSAQPYQTVYSYQGREGSIYSTDPFSQEQISSSSSDISQSQLKAMNKAKDTYLTINTAYYFNGIYFRNKNELRNYLLENTKNNLFQSNNVSKNYFLLRSATDPNVNSQPIDFFPNDKTNNVDNAKSEIKSFLSSNLFKYLQIKTPVFNADNQIISYKYTYMQIDNNNTTGLTLAQQAALETLSLSNFQYQTVNVNEGNILYIVDTNKSNDYNLVGPYFLQTHSPIWGIDNYKNWKKSSQTSLTSSQLRETSNYQITSMLSKFFDFFTSKTYNYSNNLVTNVGLSSNGTLDSSNTLFTIGQNNSQLEQLEEKMFQSYKKFQSI